MRAANAAAGIGGLTQPPVAPGAELDIRFTPPDSGFNLYAARRRRGDRPADRQRAFRPDRRRGGFAAGGRSSRRSSLLADWRLDEKGAIKDDFADASVVRAAGRLGALLTANAAPAPLDLTAAPGARVRLRLANAATARVMSIGVAGVRPLIVAVDGQPSEPFEPLRNVFPMGPGARFELMFDMPREAGAVVGFVLRGGDAAAVPGEVDRPMVVFTAQGEALARAPGDRRPDRQSAAADRDRSGARASAST